MSPSKREVLKAQRQKKQRQQRMTTLLWVGGIIVVAAVVLAIPTILARIRPVETVERPGASGRTMGDPNAPVVVEVFEDYQCPSCKIFSQDVEKPLAASDYISGGQVYYIFRQYPFLERYDTSGGKESTQAANASMCALDQGKFWEYHDYLFTKQFGENRGTFSDNALLGFATDLGLDMEQFTPCFEANAHADEIQADFDLGTSYGVSGTPSVFVNGQQITPGYVPSFEQLTQAIDAALAGGG